MFRLVPEGSSNSYLALEVCEGVADRRKLRLGRHLVRGYKRVQQPEPGVRYDGTLELTHACRATSEGFIEPSGERRQE
jgi:hypothetical protein